MANTLKFGNGNWATKEGSTLAYNDENNNFKPLPFDFTRASTATYVDSDGLIKTAGDNVPRIDYTDNTDGALLLEPARTNLLPYSTLAFNGGSSPTGYSIGFQTGTFSYNQTTYKGQNAVKQTQSTTGRSYLDTGTLTLSTGVTYTFRMEIDLLNTSVVAGEEIMSFSGFDTIITKTLSDVDEFGILEFDFTFNTDAVGNIRIGLGCFGIAAGGQYMTWGMPQIEQGSYATSYIPTQGSTVTRLADATIGNLPSSSIGQSEGVLYFEGSYFDTSEAGYIELSDGGNDNRIIVWNVDSTSLRAFIEVGNVPQVQINGGSISSNTIFKFAFKYKANDFALWVNGVEVGTAASGSTFGSNSLNQLDLQVSSVVFKGEIKDLKLYNTALTDAELATLTT